MHPLFLSVNDRPTAERQPEGESESANGKALASRRKLESANGRALASRRKLESARLKKLKEEIRRQNSLVKFLKSPLTAIIYEFLENFASNTVAGATNVYLPLQTEFAQSARGKNDIVCRRI